MSLGERPKDIPSFIDNMVLTDLKTGHIFNLTDKLNHQREDGQLCDINIVVGDKKIAAHKCVLVCESDYFKSLTLGPMKQDVSEVNLTTVTDEMEHVESVVNYIYTGKIDIQDGNLGCILGLASYLLISKLRQSCIDYMRTRGNMETSVQYYLLANEFMVSELENDFENTIRTRFHDFLIFQNDTLIISPIQLKLLMNNCDIFEHCLVGDIISFVFDWVTSGKTGEHEELGLEILDIAFNSKDRFAKRGTYLHSIEMLEKTKEKLVGENDTDFIAKAKMLIEDCLSSTHNAQPISINPDKEDPCKEKQAFLPAAANALIAFVPKQPLLDIAYDKSVHGIYVYIPREQTWYSLGDEKDGGLLSRFLSKVKIDDCLGSMLMSDRIYFISNDAVCTQSS